jgi:hypothetical protein
MRASATVPDFPAGRAAIAERDSAFHAGLTSLVLAAAGLRPEDAAGFGFTALSEPAARREEEADRHG